MTRKIFKSFLRLFIYEEEYVYQNGVNIYLICLSKEIGHIVNMIMVQFIPIWILLMLAFCLGVNFKLTSFLENILVFDIVSGCGYLIESKKGKGGEKNQHIKILSVLVVSLASVAYSGLLLSRNSIGPQGLIYLPNEYVTVTIIITQFNVLIQYLWLKKKD